MVISTKERLTEKVMLLNAMSLNRYHIIHKHDMVYLKDQMEQTIAVTENDVEMLLIVGIIVNYSYREERCR